TGAAPARTSVFAAVRDPGDRRPGRDARGAGGLPWSPVVLGGGGRVRSRLPGDDRGGHRRAGVRGDQHSALGRGVPMTRPSSNGGRHRAPEPAPPAGSPPRESWAFSAAARAPEASARAAVPPAAGRATPPAPTQPAPTPPAPPAARATPPAAPAARETPPAPRAARATPATMTPPVAPAPPAVPGTPLGLPLAASSAP